MKIEIKGVAPHLDATYDLDLGSLTNRELHEIKVVSGVRPVEMLDAIVFSDAAFACALATIASRRRGRRVNEDMFLDTSGTIRFLFDPAPDEAPPTKPGKPGSSKKSSGGSSRRASGSRA